LIDKKINSITKFPKNWAIAKLEDISSVILGQSPTSTSYNFDGKGLPFFQGKKEFGAFYPKVAKWCTEPKKIALKNDVLISVRAPVGPTNLSPAECSIGRGLAAIRPNAEISYKYLLYYLRSIESNIESLGTGTTFQAISGSILKSLLVPLAPSNEQSRIVTEIEKQFSRLDKAVDNLKRIKTNLKRYKASVLKSAVEGKLTEEWRKANTDVEPAEKLIKRILAERRKKWEEAELDKMKAKGKEPKDNLWKKKYKEPLAPVIEELYKLPNNWIWCSLGQLIQTIKAGKSFKCNERSPEGNEVGVVKVSAVSWGEFNELESKTVTDKSKVNQDYLIHRGDFLFSRANTIELVGACVITNLFERKLMLSDKILRFNFTFDLKQWCLFCLRTLFGRNEIESLATGNQESMRNISQANIMNIRLPLPPIEEQGSIINSLEQTLTQHKMINQICDGNLSRADRLRQSILKKAFTGKLVPQEKNSASNLKYKKVI
jgi:type I restriction enzyme S subunit